MNFNKAFGQLLRVLRKERQLSQEQLALESGLHRTYISLLELGQRSPTLNTMMVLCTALGVSFIDLAHRLDQIITQAEGSPTVQSPKNSG